MAEIWLYAIDPPLSGEENMRRDEEMARACAEDGIPRLRFYTWNPWTLSLGFNQKNERIDEEELRRRGYDLVRRPTGGRAVFHADEVTYGVAMPGGGKGIHETYALISEALRRGFEILGAEGVEFSRSRPDFREHYQSLDSEGCFSTSALNELAWQGRKFVGSAQRRFGSVLLQHGSILVGHAHLDIVDFMSISPELREGMRARLAERTATLSDILPGSVPDYDTISQSLLRGFAETFGVELVPTDDLLTPRSAAEPFERHSSERS